VSPLTRQAWLDAWTHLTSARQSFGEAKTFDDKERALCDMVLLSDAFRVSCLSFAGALTYDKNKREEK
jgi:hypothetical protein